MALPEGDYRVIEEQAAATLRADDGPGGLCEQGAPPVAIIRAGDFSLDEILGSFEFPAILIRVMAKTETPSAPACSLVKTYRLAAAVLDRAMDRDTAEASVRKIAARLECVLREQSRTDRQFLGLPDLIDGSEGVLVCRVRQTSFPETDAQKERVLARARVEAEIQLPCIFRFE